METQAQKYLFYLHGAVLEGENPEAGASIFKEYQYKEILSGFRKAGFHVQSEIRASGISNTAYAKQVAGQVNELLRNGVPASGITVVGGSKGALIAMYVSTFVANSEVNYVFLAACNDGNLRSNPDIRFVGNILSIYEKSDGIGETCLPFRERSGNQIPHYKEIQLNTGLGHQFLWKAIPDWMQPAIHWANGKYE